MNLSRNTIANLAVLGLIILGVIGFWSHNLGDNHGDDDGHSDSLHYHAGVQVYINGELQDYSDFKYMHISPCASEAEDHEHNLTDPKDRIHFHDQVGDVAHIHASNVTWEELFESLEISDQIDLPALFYRNGEPVDDLFKQTPQPYEAVAFVFGEPVDPEIIKANSVTREHIDETEKLVESCGAELELPNEHD